MFHSDTDRTWNDVGDSGPYFGVFTNDRVRAPALDEEAHQAFFESGERYTEFLFDALKEFAPRFRPRRVLDFGCGIGRVTLPLAARAEMAVGVDASEGMLAAAVGHSARLGARNTTFVRDDENLSRVSGLYDMIHSFIAFQHIAPRRGEAILSRLIGLLREDGVGALHFTYGFGSRTPLSRRFLVRAYQAVPLLYGLRNMVKGRPFDEPLMQMNEYNLNRLLRILEESGCHRVQVRFTETGLFGQPFYGAVILFQKSATDILAHG